MSKPRVALFAVMSGTGFANSAVGAAAALLATLFLGPASRGVMVVGITICSIVSMACSLGSGAGLRSLLPGLAGAQRRTLLVAYGWFSLAAVLVGGAVAIGVALVSAPAIDAELADPLLLAGVGIFALASVLRQQAGDLWFADGRFRAGSVGGLVITTGGLVGMICAIEVRPSASSLLLGQAAGTLLLSLGQLVVLARAGLVPAARPAHRDVAVLIRRGLPALGLTGGLVTVLRGDRYVLGLFAGPAAVGVYSLAATLAETARNIPIVSSQIFLRDTALGHGAARFPTAVQVAAVGAALTAGVVVPASWVLLVPVFGPEFADARGLLIVLVGAELCFVPYFVATAGLVGGGWTTAVGVLGGVGAVAAVGFYLVGAQALAATGAAIASVVVYAGLSTAAALLLRARLASATRIGESRA